MVQDEIIFYGHPNVRSTHTRTIEITKAPTLSLRGDCIIGVNANKACRDLKPRLKHLLQQADLVVISTSGINMQPVNDPVSAVIMQTNLSNIDSVMVAGQWRKRSGKLVAGGLSEKFDRLRESGRRILNAMAL